MDKYLKNYDVFFNENGVCTLENEKVVEIFKAIITDESADYLGSNGYEIDAIDGIVTSSQDIGRTFKFILHYDNSQKHQVVFMKLCPKWRELDAAKLEYDILCKMHAELSRDQSPLGVARPINYYPQLNAYAQESVGTRTLKTLLLKNNSTFSSKADQRELLDAIELSARWLSRFHDITATGSPEPFDHSRFEQCEACDFNFTLVDRFKFSDATRARVKSCLRDLQAVDGSEMPHAGFHFDYTPAHIFLDKGLDVIDIGGAYDMPIYEDIGHFLASLSTVNCLPFSPFFSYRRAREELIDCFLQAYKSETRFDTDRYELFANCYYMKHLFLWLGAQYQRVQVRSNQHIADLFMTTRLLSIFDPAIKRAVDSIRSHL